MKNLKNPTNSSPSTASGQRCLYCGKEYPLYPPLFLGCPNCVHDDFKAPLEIIYDYPASADWLPAYPVAGLHHYGAVLPPVMADLSMGEGGTALVRYPDKSIELFLKDESRNPTWSHKDRLNFVLASTAVAQNVKGIVAASSGNHGASAAAYAARAKLHAIILCTPRPPAVASFMQAYGQTVVAVPDSPSRWRLMEQIMEKLGYHPMSNFTNPPTNHPFGAEAYKSIAYELFLQLERRVPEAVFIPIGYGELAFGIHKGFKELFRYGLIEQLPQIIGCEPAAGAPLKQAIERNKPVVTVNLGKTNAYSIAVPTNAYRAVVAIKESEGMVITVDEEALYQAQLMLGKSGMWSEASSAISFAAVQQAQAMGIGQRGPVVCINTSSGFKDAQLGANQIPFIEGSWESFERFLNNKVV